MVSVDVYKFFLLENRGRTEMLIRNFENISESVIEDVSF